MASACMTVANFFKNHPCISSLLFSIPLQHPLYIIYHWLCSHYPPMLIILIVYPILATRYPLHATRYSLPVTRYLLPATHYPLLVTRYLLPATHYPLLVTRYTLFVTRYALPVTRYSLPTDHHLLPTTLYPLVTTYYPLSLDPTWFLPPEWPSKQGLQFSGRTDWHNDQLGAQSWLESTIQFM